jgi:hypothetical protein
MRTTWDRLLFALSFMWCDAYGRGRIGWTAAWETACVIFPRD